MRAYAAMHEVTDAETGESRPATPSDHFPPSAIETAPDLSLMAKARAGFHGPAGLGINQLLRGIGGPEYIASLLTGFTGEEQELAGAVLYGNSAFAGGWISMAPPLSDDHVTYADGTPATVEQMALDVAAFLMWAAEPQDDGPQGRRADGGAVPDPALRCCSTSPTRRSGRRTRAATTSDAGPAGGARRPGDRGAAGASTSPALIETGDGRRWVMKFTGAGPGPFGVLTEYLALSIARGLRGAGAGGTAGAAARGLSVDGRDRRVRLHAAAEHRLEPRGRLRPGRAPGATPADLAPLAGLAAIARADCFLQNMDRTARQPEPAGGGRAAVAIDYDACLYLSRALGPPRPASDRRCLPAICLPAAACRAGRTRSRASGICSSRCRMRGSQRRGSTVRRWPSGWRRAMRTGAPLPRNDDRMEG